MEQVNEDWRILRKRLEFHLFTIDSHHAQLEEDEQIEGSTPAPSPEIKKILEDYRRSGSIIRAYI
jgi:hypothetical protein